MKSEICDKVHGRFLARAPRSLIAFKFVVISLVPVTKKRKNPTPTNITPAPKRKQYLTAIYSYVIAAKYPIGVFQSNGNLEMTNWERNKSRYFERC